MRKVDLDLCDPEGLAFEDFPSSFVLLDREPITWTVRGLAYFAPRFSRVGVSIAAIRTSAEFNAALDQWLDLEFQLLFEKIERQAASVGMQLEHRAMKAILEGNAGEARRLEAIIRHRQRTDLRLAPRT